VWPGAPTPCACCASSDEGRGGPVRPARTVLEFGDLGAQRPFGVAAFGDLTHDRRYPDDLAGVVAQQRHTELDRQPVPVAVGGGHAQHLVAVAGVSGGHRLEVALPVPLPQLLRDDHVQVLSHRFVGRITEQARGPVVPQPDDSGRVGHHNGLGGFPDDRRGEPFLGHTGDPRVGPGHSAAAFSHATLRSSSDRSLDIFAARL